MHAVDTNVLLYVHDPRDPAKQAQASSLVSSIIDGVLLWQVASEYLSASRKLEPHGYRWVDAWNDVRDLRKVWTTFLPSWNVLDETERLIARYSLSFWDGMIIAACLECGVTRLYSEDFSAYPKVNGLEIVNPFASLGSALPP
jgi:predicted nucleic acid-binding protein